MKDVQRMIKESVLVEKNAIILRIVPIQLVCKCCVQATVHALHIYLQQHRVTSSTTLEAFLANDVQRRDVAIRLT